jgi:hypothetical protein
MRPKVDRDFARIRTLAGKALQPSIVTLTDLKFTTYSQNVRQYTQNHVPGTDGDEGMCANFEVATQ